MEDDVNAADGHPLPMEALDYANRALRRAQAVHKALGTPWAVWRDGAVHWIAPEDLPDLRPEDREQLPDSSAPPPLHERPRRACIG